MAKGKPPGIRRKQAKQEPDLLKKRSLNEYGDVAECLGEYSLIWGILVDALERRQTRFQFIRDSKATNEKIVSCFLSAVRALDSKFFERCIRVIEWIRKGRPMADPKGAEILRAIWYLAQKEDTSAELSSGDVADFIDKESGHQTIFDHKEIRDIVHDLGLGGFPLSVRKIRAEIHKACQAHDEQRNKSGSGGK